MLQIHFDTSAKMQHLDNPIKQCIRRGDLEGFKALLKGKSINAPLADGWTVLHHVCAEGQHSFLDYLFSRGASANSEFEFFTPLMATCGSSLVNQEELLQCAKILIDHHADLDAMDKTKVTALMYACNSGHEKLVRLLLESQCDVNRMDNDGYTAIHLACMYNHASIVQILLEFGADKKVKDRRGRLPIDLAISKGADDIIEMLNDSQQEIAPPTEVIYEIEKTSFEQLLTELPSYTSPSGKDGFHKDVEILLSGMRLEQSTNIFLEKNISLAQFLNITDDELKSLGLHFSSHRSRVITGNKRFVCQAWGEHSLPKENKNASIMDITRALANSVKHIHIMFCTAFYCNNRIVIDEEKTKVGDLFDVTLRTHRQIKTLINELKFIQEKVEYLEKIDPVKPADLVLPMKPKGYSCGKIFFVSALCALLAWKGNCFNMLRK